MSTDALIIAAIKQVRALRAHELANPLEYVAWLPGQLAWLSDPGPQPKLFRAGNRGGKTWGACAEVIYRALGHHPFNASIPKGPVKIAFITSDKQAQGVQIMGIFWSLVPKHELDPNVDYNERTGFRGHVPVVKFRNGSTVTWYSNRGGAKSIQGGGFDYVQIDEPCSEDLFEEAKSRVRETGGQVGITLTPLHLPVPWLREMCEKGAVTDHHYPLTVESQTSPMTGEIRLMKNGRPWDQERIDEIRADVIGPGCGVIIDGDWETRSVGQWFDVFSPDLHVTRLFPSHPIEWRLGFDYATADRTNGLCAVLSGVDWVMEKGARVPEVWTIDEVVMPGSATMTQFAEEIRKMLGRYRLKWRDLDDVWGDNSVRSRGQESSNNELARAMALLLGLTISRLRPRIVAVKEGGGSSGPGRRSKDVRSKWMYHTLAKARAHIHPRCKVLIQALEEYDYSDKHPLKDVTDAWMYGLKDLWTVQTKRIGPRLLVG